MARTPNQSIKSKKNKIKTRMFSTSKMKRSKNPYDTYATKFAGSTHKYCKMAGRPNQQIKSTKKSKKV
jgi:hypothetical protein